MKASARKSPPPHQLICVKRFPAWRMPSSESADELMPPKLAARPPPLPLCARMASTSTILSRIRRTRRNVYIEGALEGDGVFVSCKYAVTYGLASSLGDGQPSARLEARPAHEESVHVGRVEQRARILSLDAAAVEDGDRGCRGAGALT